MKLRLILFFVLTALSFITRAQQGFPFADEIRDFKRQDSLKFPPKNGVLFIGSSSIRLWDNLEQRFSGKPVIKRGVGGCTLQQLVSYYTPYILFPYQPRKVFIYAGENDIAEGETGAFVAQEFNKLWDMLNQKLPGAEVYYMAIKPSPSRAKLIPEMTIANSRIKTFLANKKEGHYLDMASVILNPATQQPDSTLFKADYLHLNNKGYDKWQAVLQPFVK